MPVLFALPPPKFRSFRKPRESKCSACLPPISSSAISTLLQVYTTHNAHIHRGSCAHTLGRLAAESLQTARQRLAQSVNARSETEIVFSSNAKMAMSVIARAISSTLKRGGEVIMVQNTSNWIQSIWKQAVKKQAGRLVTVPDLNFMSLAPRLSPRTAAVVAQLDVVQPSLTEVTTFTSGMGIPIIIEATSIATTLDVQNPPFSIAIIDGTSLGAPGGAFWYGRHEIIRELPPVLGSETTLEQVQLQGSFDRNNWAPIPERFESGMVPLAQVCALATVFEDLRTA